jgi:hypothetical protein
MSALEESCISRRRYLSSLFGLRFSLREKESGGVDATIFWFSHFDNEKYDAIETKETSTCCMTCAHRKRQLRENCRRPKVGAIGRSPITLSCHRRSRRRSREVCDPVDLIGDLDACSNDRARSRTSPSRRGCNFHFDASTSKALSYMRLKGQFLGMNRETPGGPSSTSDFIVSMNVHHTMILFGKTITFV